MHFVFWTSMICAELNLIGLLEQISDELLLSNPF